MLKFKFYWKDGKSEVGVGYNVADAFTNLGYGSGALGALDYYRGVPDGGKDAAPDEVE